MHFVNAKGILSAHNGMNVYRGCTHGCIYCDSRSLCYQMNHDFEDIEVKKNAPQLLEEALRRKRYKCMIATGAMCDPYMPCEEQLRITRQCFEKIEAYGFGVSFQTKSNLFLRDIELLKSINRRSKCVVEMTLTTYDEALCRIIEPNVCTTRRRYEALKVCQEAGIPTVVWITPLLPFINDTEENLRGVLDYCFDAGVKGVIFFHGGGMTLRAGDREYYYAALDRHFPGLKARYIQTYGDSYELPSPNGHLLTKLLHTLCREHGVMCDNDEIFSYLYRLGDGAEQISLF